MNNPRHKARRYSSDPLKRSVVACNRCRGRKTKCLGNAPYPCMSCEDVGAECIYPNVEERIYVPKSYLANLQARADAADSERTTSASEPSPAALVNEDDDDDEEDDWWYQGMENLFVSRSGEHHYVGKSSSTYLATTLNPTSNVAWDVSPMYNDNLWLRRSPNISQPQLPPFDFAKRLYEQQYIYIGSIFAFVQPKHFEERLKQVYELPIDTSNREDCLVHCQILLLLAFGQMYSLNQWSGSEGPPGFVYFKHALRFLPDIHEEGSILFVEVLGLVAYYLQILNRRDAAFLYIGLALRMAISLGLHQEVSNSDMNPIEREHRRRVWWSTYSMDRILCVKSGNPISIHDEDIAVAFPSFHPPFDSSPSPPLVLAHYSQLSRILGKIGEQIYRRRHQSGKGLVASVQAIMMELAAWLKDIPPELTLDFTTFHLRISREAVSTFLHYYHCVNMTGRPLLLHICQKRINSMAEGTASRDWTQGLSSGIVNVVKNSVAAARAATTVVDAAEKHNVLATYGFMDGEHAFSAALILVMVNVAFPYNERDHAATEQSLKNLKGMADKGNEYIKARHVLLLNLRSALRKRTQSAANPDATALVGPIDRNDMFTGSNLAAEYPNDTAYGAQTQTLPGVQPLVPIQETPRDDDPLRGIWQGYQDVFVDLNMEDDQGIWDELNGNVELDMNADWIQDALRQEQT